MENSPYIKLLLYFRCFQISLSFLYRYKLIYFLNILVYSIYQNLLIYLLKILVFVVHLFVLWKYANIYLFLYSLNCIFLQYIQMSFLNKMLSFILLCTSQWSPSRDHLWDEKTTIDFRLLSFLSHSSDSC